MEAFIELIDDHVWVLIPLGAFVFITIGSVTDALRKASQTKAKEETRRELAAYVAEGSMTTDEAERLLAVGTKHRVGSRSDKA